jgi:benzoyl-CoA reductase/2-hydroxyglutaryl-CoA dehydratase subunit BcrC/BadD/HgdB
MCGYLAFLPALLSDVDGVVLTTCCDQLRRAAEWLEADDRVFLFNYPSTLHQERLVDAEKARLKKWVDQLTSRERAERSDAGRQEPQDARVAHSCEGQAIGVIGAHFCGERQAVENFFAQRGLRVALWGCEGGESVGDVAQRPNDAFYNNMKALIAERQLAGLVVVRTTWCDLWRLACVRLHEVLDIPVLEWVTDGQSHGQPFPDGASGTRLEAFCELIQAKRQEAP